jgi:hydrogenase maturation protease
MSADLPRDLARCLAGGVCLVGIGNPDLGDDAVGVLLAERLRPLPGVEVVSAGTTPEHWVGSLAEGGYDNVVFLDAVQIAGAPGAVILLDATDLRAVFPQISTHRMSLGTLAQLIGREGGTRVWLLGVKPGSLRGPGLTPAVDAAMRALATLIAEARGAATGTAGGAAA